MKRLLTLSIALCLLSAAPASFAESSEIFTADESLQVRAQIADEGARLLRELGGPSKGSLGSKVPHTAQTFMDQIFIDKTLDLLARSANAFEMSDEEVIAHAEEVQALTDALSLGARLEALTPGLKMGPTVAGEESCSSGCLKNYIECSKQLENAHWTLGVIVCGGEYTACNAACLLN